MGVFDFIKTVGEKVFGASEDKPPQSDAIKEQLSKLGLEAKGVEVKVEGDTIKLSGRTPTTEEREKIILAAGNTLGVAKVEDNLTVDRAGEAARFYTVKKGDTLWEIAEAQYGKGKGAEHKRIFEANKPMLKAPDKIYPGQMLRIPALTSGGSATA